MAVTVAYLWEGLGVSVAGAPNGAVASKINTVVATIVATSATDTSALVTHAFNLPAADITSGFAEAVITHQGDPTTSPWFEASQNPNFSIFQKNTLGIGAQAKVFIHRPHTIVR